MALTLEDLDEVLTLAQAARELGLSKSTLRTQHDRGRFGARVIDGVTLTVRDEVERYRRESIGQAGRPRVVEIASLPWPANPHGPLRIIGFTWTPEADAELVTLCASEAIEGGVATIHELRDQVRDAIQQYAPGKRIYLLTQTNPPTLSIAREFSRADAVESGREVDG